MIHEKFFEGLPKWIIDKNDVRYKVEIIKATEIEKGYHVRYVSEEKRVFSSTYGVTDQEAIQRTKKEIFCLPIIEIRVDMEVDEFEKD